jgi:hypothetical protein
MSISIKVTRNGQDISHLSKPSLARQAAKLAGAVGRVIKAATQKAPIAVSAEEKERRLGLCYECEFYRPIPYMHCLKCGCSLSLKTRLETEHCPISKW